MFLRLRILNIRGFFDTLAPVVDNRSLDRRYGVCVLHEVEGEEQDEDETEYDGDDDVDFCFITLFSSRLP